MFDDFDTFDDWMEEEHINDFEHLDEEINFEELADADGMISLDELYESGLDIGDNGDIYFDDESDLF